MSINENVPGLDAAEIIEAEEDNNQTVVDPNLAHRVQAELMISDEPEGVTVSTTISDDITAPYPISVVQTPIDPESVRTTPTRSNDLIVRTDLRNEYDTLTQRANILAARLLSLPAILAVFSTARAWITAHAPYKMATASETRCSLSMLNGALERWIQFIEDRVLALVALYQVRGGEVPTHSCNMCGYLLPLTPEQVAIRTLGAPFSIICSTCEARGPVQRFVFPIDRSTFFSQQ